MQHNFDDPLEVRRERVIRHLLRGSFEADFFSFQRFDAKNPNPAARDLAKALGSRLDQLASEQLL
jgi:hypothetical protein